MHPPVRLKLERVHVAIEGCSMPTVLAGFFVAVASLVGSTFPCCVMCCCAKKPEVCCSLLSADRPRLAGVALQPSVSSCPPCMPVSNPVHQLCPIVILIARETSTVMLS
jgi:hypothetical protein